MVSLSLEDGETHSLGEEGTMTIFFVVVLMKVSRQGNMSARFTDPCEAISVEDSVHHHYVIFKGDSLIVIGKSSPWVQCL